MVEKVGVFEFVGVEVFYYFLVGVDYDVVCEGKVVEVVVGVGVEFEGVLVFEFVEDVLFNFFDGVLCVDEVVVVDFFE